MIELCLFAGGNQRSKSSTWKQYDWNIQTRFYLADFAGDAGGRLAHPGPGTRPRRNCSSSWRHQPDVVADWDAASGKAVSQEPAGWFPELKKMLTDSRSKVRRKAGRVLGVLHAEVDQTDLNNLVAMFKASGPARK